MSPKQAGNTTRPAFPPACSKPQMATSISPPPAARSGSAAPRRSAHRNPDYATGPARSKNRDALNAAISACTEKRTTDEWVNELNAAGVPCGPIYSIDQMLADEQVKHLGIAQDVPNDENRAIRLVGQPFTLSRTPSKMAARPPEVGEQTEELLGEFGFSADEIAVLKQSKVV
ncbi:crotonobetainyl-CoA:carnitine CoA-transferase CaiB-like acyl-CoA transferase [Nitrobacteraceae bacterium AZCC 2161]